MQEVGKQRETGALSSKNGFMQETSDPSCLCAESKEEKEKNKKILK